ncbi:uncharacterized protein LOC112682088 [Sipha flava]|jgi:hypothetical protein|uniref:Uncharacterized protein LOC112682088 n=1 Tax=Sipha flava TaxID=143950 RepID=A0A8B8FBU6_9HEMI|nr:uncharacterized protein LOC112682088 [Sipha flava]
MYPNVICTRPCARVNVIRSNFYEDDYDTDKSYASSRYSETFYKDIKCQSSQTDLILIDKSTPTFYSWQRSSSCKDFISPRSCSGETPLVENEEVNSSFDRNSSLDHPITKIFSSSYPGTTSSLSTESGSDRKLEKVGSVRIVPDTDDMYQDDISQDSYELLEKEIFDTTVSDEEDEIFYVENDNKENTLEIEKRLGYLEPKYRDIEFNKFNEICKKELASRSKEQIFTNNTIRFNALENKSETSHVPVERTKSDSYMSAPKHKPHKLLHQKSIDLTPLDNFEPSAVKLELDIPYILHKRHTFEGSSNEENTVKWSTIKCGSDHYSQDSGLSLSAQSTSYVSVEDDSPVNLDTLLLNKYHDNVVTTCKSSELIQMAYKSTSFNESDVKTTTNDKVHKLKSCHSADSVPVNKGKKMYYQPRSADTGLKKEVEVIQINPEEDIKPEDVKIVEYRGGKAKKIRKDSVVSKDNKSLGSASTSVASSSPGLSPERCISNSPKKENIFKSSAVKIKIATALSSNSNHVVPNVVISDDNNITNDNNIPMEYSALPDIVSNSVNNSKITYSEITQNIKPKKVETSSTGKDEEQVVPISNNFNETKLKLKSALSCMMSSHPNIAPQPTNSESKTNKINKFQSLASRITNFDVITNNTKIDQSLAELPKKKLTDKIPQKREKSPVLFARLGLSEGSAFPNVPGQSQSQRRAISLDSPVVSLHQLPLVTSFSSKDDTVDNEDDIELEEKPIKWWNIKVDETIVECLTYLIDVVVGSDNPDSISLSPSITPERRRSSTRQERLDSFKKLKNFEIEVWDSEELNVTSTIDYEHKDFEDETFIVPVSTCATNTVTQKHSNKCSTDDDWVSVDDSGSSEEIPFKELDSQSSDETKRTTQKTGQSVSEIIEDTVIEADNSTTDKKDNCEKEPEPNLDVFTEEIDHAELINKLGCIEIPPKLEPKRHHKLSLESSGSSSLDDPPHMDDLSGNIADEEDVTSSPLPPTPDVTYSGMYLIGYGVYGMSRTLSRISEQSTSEKSEIDDELSTKYSTQSASLDDSILSSDCQPSLCSDAMDSLPDLPPLPVEYAFDIPSPIEEWPSPKSEELTPIEQKHFDDDEDAKTINNDDVVEEKDELRRAPSTNKPRLSFGDDTSAGISTSEFSSNATILHHYDNVCPPPEFLNKDSDEYDSPFTESDESKFYRPPAHMFELPKTSMKTKKSRMPHGPASLDATVPKPKTLATRARCHSYFSLTRSPPSDASSSSLEAQEPPNVPNTIPRASKRRRYTHTLKRKPKVIQITKV